MMKVYSFLWLALSLLACDVVSAQGYEPMLIGGRPALKDEYPEVVYIRSGNARCSATVIGPETIMTAGHCVADNGSIGPVGMIHTTLHTSFETMDGILEEDEVDFVKDQVVYTATCHQAPLYRDQVEDHDMALCKTNKPMPGKYATVSKVGPKLGDQVYLSGYGCTQPGGGQGNDGVLRVGKAKVTKLPSGKDHWFYTQDKSALCFGDSGGPSFMVAKKHLVIGVNSRGNIKDLSLLTATFTPESLKFFEDFAESESVKICGVNVTCR